MQNIFFRITSFMDKLSQHGVSADLFWLKIDKDRIFKIFRIIIFNLITAFTL